MSNLITADDQRKYGLQKAGESSDKTSDYDIFTDAENGIKDLDLMNELYRALHYGGVLLDIDFNETFDWLKSYDPQILTIIPPFETGTVSLTNGSASGTLSSAPTGLGSLKNHLLKISGRPTYYRIASHTADSTSITLDQNYLEVTGATLDFKIIKTDYELATRVAQIYKELRTDKFQFDEDPDGVIKFMTEDSFDQRFPRKALSSGTPSVFTIVKNQQDILTLRFNHYPRTDKLRVEIPYIPVPEELRIFELATTDIDPSTNIITENNHRLVSNQIVQFTSTGTLPSGLLLNTNYYIIILTKDTFRVSTTEGGTQVDLTDEGTGAHTLSSVPKLPAGNRELLGNYIASSIALDKSDARSDSFLRTAQAQLQSIIGANRKSQRKASKSRGRLIPRLDNYPRRYTRFRDEDPYGS